MYLRPEEKGGFDVVDTRTGHVTLTDIGQGAALQAAQRFNAGWASPTPFRVFPKGAFNLQQWKDLMACASTAKK